MLKRAYDWVLSWAHTPYGVPALFILAFSESSFFPIPPDVLLIALALSRPSKAFTFAAICSIGSIFGGIFGYAIGFYFMELVGEQIIALYGLTGKYEYIQELYRNYDAWAVGIAGFTPIPYKAFTITAGAFKINFPVFVGASLVSRSLRFFIVSALIYKYGKPIKNFIERYFNILSLFFVLILVGGFILLKYIIH